ncbi:MAG: DNA-directed RNA polymerase subunit beta [Alphaproteobacteria bacterium]|jgi:DNA-directed RNA polymerase subunit beta|nr:DNA-directed RNA polymerase subunit beta [Alphaproteobacteria bacterium]
MVQQNTVRRIRKSFGKIKSPIEIPNLIELQLNSYKDFLQRDVNPEEREDIGLQGVFKSVFPIETNNVTLEFVKYELESPKYNIKECVKKDLTYEASMRLTLRMIVWEVDEKTKERTISDIKEQEVFMGEIPLMTEKATFIFNGTERVVVSQVQRAPGVFFSHDSGKSHASGKVLFAAKIIPYRGSWLDFEFDHKDVLYIRIDKRRKIPATVLLKALEEGEMNLDEKVLERFYCVQKAKKTKDGWVKEFDPSLIVRPIKARFDYVNADTGKIEVAAGEKISARKAKKMAESGFNSMLINEENLVGMSLAKTIIDEENKDLIARAGEEITEEMLERFNQIGLKELSIPFIDNVNSGHHIQKTMEVDKTLTKEDALFSIYNVVRPGDLANRESAEALLENLFFNSDRYDLSKVGRYKMNLKFGVADVDNVESRCLSKDDIVNTVKELLKIKDGKSTVDDIDNLANRRIRAIGELMENQYRIGLVALDRTVREKINVSQIDTLMPQDLINSRPMSASIKEFLGSSQLSQFMDQNNPLSEVSHKRRVSALGNGGLSRDRAGFEVRDVHTTHYGRICPIETPEGPSIGLINNLASYAKVNKYGFLETPYKKVVDSKVTDEVVYMSPIQEKGLRIAQTDSNLDKDGKFTDEYVVCRENGEYVSVPAGEVEYIDISPQQVVSVTSALIPFLENDDANRALMGSNMQRQAVPLIQNQVPVVGTGMESKVAVDSKSVVVANNDGFVKYVDASRIVVQCSAEDADSNSGVDIYRLDKYERSNQNTCINQSPLVKCGDKVVKGDVLADGPCTELGELALGRNVKVAFMTWNGYNFEDSIIISEKLVRDDAFTSVHIEEFEVSARDTKLGAEEITRDIPNTGEEALKNLDEAGIVHVGARVKAGDILVGKVTPKGESVITPEEKLLRAIFGEKAMEVRDTSLRMHSGSEGTVIDVQVLNRKGVEKDERSLAIEQVEIDKINKDMADEKQILFGGFKNKLSNIIINAIVKDGITGVIKKGEKLTSEIFEKLGVSELKKLSFEKESVQKSFDKAYEGFNISVQELEEEFEAKKVKVQEGNVLAAGVLKTVKVFVAIKRKLKPGDKLAGRHGNKGIVSRIVPVEDMPFMENGEPVDIILSPLGLPSRMNIGQILETHLGWAAKGLGQQIGDLAVEYKKSQDDAKLKSKLKEIYEGEDMKRIDNLSGKELLDMSENLAKGVTFATPVFDGATDKDISGMLEKAGAATTGQQNLWDGRTGEMFDRQITVGYIYMLKLHHLVDEKMHARSIGPYSLVTQQPLGGKAQFGGQRFGEMEVWALEAYGAAYTLQEMLTVKSDDVAGRTKVYESIIRGNHNFESGTPESFNVLTNELKALGINVELKYSTDEDENNADEEEVKQIA